MLIGLIAAFVTNLNPQHGVALGAYVSIARVLMPVMAGTIMSTWLRMAADTSYASLSAFVQAGEPLVVERIRSSGLSGIASVIARESQVIAHIDGFHLVFWASLLSLMLAVLLRSSPANPIAPPVQGSVG